MASFCLLTVFGLLPVGLTSDQNAAQQTSAAGIVTGVAADLRGSPVLGGKSSQFQIPVPIASGTSTHTLFFTQSGGLAGTIDQATAPAQARYRATVNF